MSPCNCNKRVRPLGSGTTSGTTSDTSTFYSPGTPTPPLGGSVYVLDGVSYGSRLEYVAALRRSGQF